jgi:hypothetical protein
VYSISDVKTARKKYDETIQAAKEEIMLLTSSEGFMDFCKKLSILKKLTLRGVSIKIMAPIIRKNLEALEQLSQFCTIKHVPINYWRTMIVDERHLLQFRPPPTDQEKPESIPHFESAFYSNDLKYVKVMKCALDDIWKKAQSLSAIKLESTLRPYGPAVVPLPKDSFLKKGDIKVIDFKPPGTLTEKDVLNKIINARKFPLKDTSKVISRLYASQAMAIIHPPDYFNLPDMMIQATHAEKQSTWGGDFLVVFLWLDTPKGHTLVPVAVAAEENQEDAQIFKTWFAGTPAEQNIQMVKKDEIQVIVHGNTLFAGWTVPIQLFPSQYILPPACLLIEGYGEVETIGHTIVPPSGVKAEMEGNYFAAFVTFIHPASKYSGPGTDGLFARDFIMTKYSP